VIIAELARVTPPIGANVFVIRRTAPEVPMGEIFMAVLPLVVGKLVVLALLIASPRSPCGCRGR
jgi:TRAP-type C4-dicarboxylate transport system permease large subunit